MSSVSIEDSTTARDAISCSQNECHDARTAVSNAQTAGEESTSFGYVLVENLIAAEFDHTQRSNNIQSIARRVQRTIRTLRADIAHTIRDAQEENLVLAATHLWRAKMHVRLSELYTDKMWDNTKFPRRFYIKYRGFGPTHAKGDLADFRKMYLRCALSNAERAVDLAPFSYECVMFKACTLCLLVSFGGYVCETYCEQTLMSCRRAMTLHRLPQIADDRERAILYNSSQDRDSVQTRGSRRSDASMASLWNMAIFAAHTVAQKRGGWDADTVWADRQLTFENNSPGELSVPTSFSIPTNSLEELVSWNMWDNDWAGATRDGTSSTP